jgi:hypothetical protein
MRRPSGHDRKLPIATYLLPIALLLASLACNALLPPQPALEWDQDPAAVIVEAHVGGGMLYEPNAIYSARLWGDGRLFWLTFGSPIGARTVWTATLTSEAMRDLLKQFANAGFFGWDDHYSPGLVHDAPSRCLRVTLAAAAHGVCETISGAPARFWELYSLVAAGAGQAGVPYIPERGYLTLFPLGGRPPDSMPAAWPREVTGLTLAEAAAAGGLWLEGEALAFVWEAVNANPLQPVIWDGESYYTAQLLVPGLTVIAPPPDP